MGKHGKIVKQLIFCLTLTCLSLVILPMRAEGCSACVASITNSFFPFMWEAIWILAVWRIVYLYFQVDFFKKQPFSFLVREIVALGLLYIIAWRAFLFLYLAGYLVVAIIMSLLDWKQLMLKAKQRNAFLVHATAVVVLVPIVLLGFREYKNQDDLDRLRNYVYPGTGQSRSLAMMIGKDKNLDLQRLREMLESPDDQDSMKAFEVLRQRNVPSDLILLKDIILEIPESEYYWETGHSPRTSIFLPIWLSSVTGSEIRTRNELESWIKEKENSLPTPEPLPF